MAVKENTCVLAYLQYKLMPLISSKSDPLCVYLHTTCYRPTKGKDIRIFAGGWLSNPGVHSCRHLPVAPHRHTHCCATHTLPAAWHSFMLELLALARIQSVPRDFWLWPQLVEGHWVKEDNSCQTAISVYSLLLGSRLSPVSLQGRNYLKLVPLLCSFEVRAAI